MPIYDVSLPISPNLPVWPGDAPVEMVRDLAIERGDDINLTRVAFSAHTGTHIDAPRHYLVDGAGIDRLALDALIGPALVVEIIGVDVIGVADLAALNLPPDTTRLLIKTANSRRWRGAMLPNFDEGFVALDAAAARWVVERGIQLVGVDGLGVERFHAEPGNPVHRTLLGASVVIIEGLNLADVPAGQYTLIALPLRLVDADGAPARVVLMTND